MHYKCVAWTVHLKSVSKSNTHPQKNKGEERTLKSLHFEIQAVTVQMSASASCVNLQSSSHLLCVINSELKHTVMLPRRPMSRKTSEGLWGIVKQNFSFRTCMHRTYLGSALPAFAPSWTRKPELLSSRPVPCCPAHTTLLQWCLMGRVELRVWQRQIILHVASHLKRKQQSKGLGKVF